MADADIASVRGVVCDVLRMSVSPPDRLLLGRQAMPVAVRHCGTRQPSAAEARVRGGRGEGRRAFNLSHDCVPATHAPPSPLHMIVCPQRTRLLHPFTSMCSRSARASAHAHSLHTHARTQKRTQAHHGACGAHTHRTPTSPARVRRRPAGGRAGALCGVV